MSAVNNVNQIPQAAPSGQPPQNPQQLILNFNEHVQALQAPHNKPWHERAIAHLDNCARRLDHKVPNSIIQNKIDELGRAIENKFAPLKKFNDWLDKNEMGSWYKQLAMFLVTLPVKAVRNIVRLLYSIIKGAFYTAVHPMKAAVKLAKLLVRLAHELTKPETWSKMGAGILGATVGQALVTGNPFSVIGLGIGAGMVVGGITVGLIMLESEKGQRWEAIKDYLLLQLRELPEAALTGFIMGLIMGGIERAVTPPMAVRIQERIQEYVHQIIQQNNFPPSTTWAFNPSDGQIAIYVPWEGSVPELVGPFADPWTYQVSIRIWPKFTDIIAENVLRGKSSYIPITFKNIGNGYPSTLLPQAASPPLGAAGGVSTLSPLIGAVAGYKLSV